jgi:hypothetical protein
MNVQFNIPGPVMRFDDQIELAERSVIAFDELIGEACDLRRRIARCLSSKQKSRGDRSYGRVSDLEAPLLEMRREL